MWSIFCLFLSVIYVSYAEENIITNSTKPLFESRIIGGSGANIVDHPHHLALLYESDFMCGASLIAWKWALTAAHCTSGISASKLKVRGGSRYWNKLGVTSKVTAIYINPKYTRATLTHDSSLMKINSLESFANTYNIGLVSLATTLPSIDKNVILAGWGITSMTSDTPEQLRSATLKIIDRNLCSSSYNLDNSMFCAGKWSGGIGFCLGDSGGGLRYGQELIGIVSYFSTTCGAAYYPGVYCSIPVVRDWILNTMQMN